MSQGCKAYSLHEGQGSVSEGIEEITSGSSTEVSQESPGSTIHDQFSTKSVQLPTLPVHNAVGSVSKAVHQDDMTAVLSHVHEISSLSQASPSSHTILSSKQGDQYHHSVVF
jgi:hypothetical protein